jgi:hypothetical protein
MAGRGSLLGQATEAREGPALQLRLGLLITAQGGAHDGQLSRAQGQDAGFAPLTEGQGGGGMGYLFISDLGTNTIRKVGTHGMITTFAGNGTGGYAGDGGPPANAELYYPSGVALDAAENLLIADEENQLQFVRIFWFDSRQQTCIIQLAVLICIKANERIAQL